MTLDNVLQLGTNAHYLVDAPWGPIISRVSADVRASLPRIEKDYPAIVAFLNEVIPVVQKHWPAVGPAINDLLPILQQIAKDMKQ